MNDPPIHLQNYCICKSGDHTEPSVTVPVWITQSSLDGLNSLIRFHEGMQREGRGEVPGSFELVMFYRTLRSSILTADAEARHASTLKTAEHSELFELTARTKIGGTTYEEGWYFWDEAGMVGGGPYECSAEAAAGFKVYVERLQAEEPPNVEAEDLKRPT